MTTRNNGPAITRRRKQWWTEPEWREYIVKLCQARWLLENFLDNMPLTRGLRTAHVDAFLKAHRELEYAMIALENTVVEHLGGEDRVPGGAISFCQGRFAEWVKDVKIPRQHYPRGREPLLSPAEWTVWGARAKDADGLLGRAIVQVYRAKGKDVKRHIRRLEKARKALLKGRSGLDDVVCDQHPDWRDATKVFFGASAS
jgi:hypothetical protein